MATNKNLGHVQRAILRVLHENGQWTQTAGWNWNGVAATTRLLDRLAERGFVSRTAHPTNSNHYIYRPTNMGGMLKVWS